MKILVTGGYGFIGSSIAEKLIKEKHKVTIIDDLSSGSQKHVGLKHNGIVLDTSSYRCDKIFADNQFDVVINAARYNSHTHLNRHSMGKSANLVGLRNILELSLKHGVGRFVFLSSYQVYDLGREGIDESAPLLPIDDEGKDYLYQENYCVDYMDKGIDMTILRLSNVYGPRQQHSPASLPSHIGWNAVNGLKTICTFNKNQYEDYIYVADMADAVLKTIENPAPLYMNISSNEKVYSKTISENCDHYLSHQGFEHDDIDILSDEVISFTLENSIAKTSVGWFPLTTIEEGIGKTFNWITQKNKYVINGKSENSEDIGRTEYKKIYPVIENLGIFIAFMLLTLFLNNMIKVDIDVFMIYVVLICMFYGLEQGSISVSLASLGFIFLRLSEGSDIAYILFDLSNVFHIALYVIIGTSIGYSVDKKKYEEKLMTRDMKDIQKELLFVEEVYEKSILIKNALQSDIENYDNSFGKVLQITEKLNKISTEEIYNESVKVISELMNAQNVAMYYLDTKSDYARMIASWGEDDKYDKSMLLTNYPYLNQVIDEMKTFTNNDLIKGAAMIASPVVHENEVVAVVLIDEIAFENLSLHYMNMLKVVMMLISNAIGSASQYQDAVEEQKYYGETQILKNEWFEKIASMRKAAEKDQLVPNYTLELDLTIHQGIKEYEKLCALTRSVDYIGETKNNKVAVMFSNASVRDRHIVKSRFEQEGYRIE